MSECMNLWVQSFNFDHLILTVHDGKGKKDRMVPLPETLIPKLKVQLETVKTLHDSDLAEGSAGTFLFDSLGKNIKTLPKNCPGNGFFQQRH
ncbi:MAG: tyrosine-type recombinase/integrase [Desulfobacterales bacterium]|nr:tyrosine-type recombinase/integrase [Desulfobacterales bacterium]